MQYVIETLKIEMYRLAKVLRVIESNEHDAQTSFASSLISCSEKINEIDKAIKILEEAQSNT